MGDRYRRILSENMADGSTIAATVPIKHSLTPLQEKTFLDFVRRLNRRDELDGSLDRERRRSIRQPYLKTIVVTPCNLDRQPRIDESFQTVTKDLSTVNVGFVYTRALRDKLAIVTLNWDTPSPISLLVEIKRVQPTRQGLYIIGGEFLERLGSGESGSGEPNGEPAVESAGVAGEGES